MGEASAVKIDEPENSKPMIGFASAQFKVKNGYITKVRQKNDFNRP